MSIFILFLYPILSLFLIPEVTPNVYVYELWPVSFYSFSLKGIVGTLKKAAKSVNIIYECHLRAVFEEFLGILEKP